VLTRFESGGDGVLLNLTTISIPDEVAQEYGAVSEPERDSVWELVDKL